MPTAYTAPTVNSAAPAYDPLPRPSFLRALADWVLPWLCSTSLHACLVLLLLLGVYLQGPAPIVPRGLPARRPMEITFLSGGAGDLHSPGADIDGGDVPGKYYNDEPAFLADQLGPPRLGGGQGNSTSLGALLNEAPKVSMAGVLPAAGFGNGVGTSAGDGVGSASGWTREPRGTRELRGGYAHTNIFGAQAEGRHFVYVFDRSGSMDMYHGAPLAAAKRELIASLNDLDQVHQFQIIFYNEQPKVFNPTGVPGRLVLGNDENKRAAQKFVGSITADGATRHEDALKMALRMGADVIFFLTDADEPRMTDRQLSDIRKLNRGTSINAIEFGYGPQVNSDNFLAQLARENSGQHVYVDVARLPGARR